MALFPSSSKNKVGSFILLHEVAKSSEERKRGDLR